MARSAFHRDEPDLPFSDRFTRDDPAFNEIAVCLARMAMELRRTDLTDEEIEAAIQEGRRQHDRLNPK
ncbi:hypothetical protein ACWGKO_16655 [Streptomyces griseoincarnatus]